MCSDPQMYLNKETGELNEGACRNCDQCLAVRRHGWEARAMAEKAMWNHTLCLALTYNDETQENRDSAQMFNYADVRAFVNRVRSACRDEAKRQRANQMPKLKFLCAGEQGGRNGRCHWHLIIYCDMDLRLLGEVRGKFGVITDPGQMMTVGKRKRRLHWSLWGRGFVTFQEPDQGGMHYVLSYCLKDQFTVERSEHTARAAKAENFATGLFRMSKRPPIGETWLLEKMERLLEQGAVLPSLQITIPGFRGYWFPSGNARKRLLWHLKAVANKVRWRRGKDAPQWSGLIHHCQDNPSDMEILIGQETEERKKQILAEARFTALAERNAFQSAYPAGYGDTLPCGACLAVFDGPTLKALGVQRDKGGAYTHTPGRSPISDRRRQTCSGNSFTCQNRWHESQGFTYQTEGHGEL